METSIKLRAMRFIQHGKTFYLTAMPAGDLLDISEVDTWSSDEQPEKTGYQRAPSAQRKKQIAEYVSQPDSILPQGGLLNARNKMDGEALAEASVLAFNPDPGQEGSITSGWLEIKYSDCPIYIVDMQHRLYG